MPCHLDQHPGFPASIYPRFARPLPQTKVINTGRGVVKEWLKQDKDSLLTSFDMVNTAEARTSKDDYNVNHVNSVLDKKPVHDEQRDYTGTAKKTDPKEIRLVRKLDWWIMVSFPLPLGD